MTARARAAAPFRWRLWQVALWAVAVAAVLAEAVVLAAAVESAAGTDVVLWISIALWSLLLGVVLVAVGVAAAGPIAFVSFLAGPIARALNGGRTTILGSALAGALIVVAADYVADYLIPDTNLPVGVVTGAVGAPFLLWLLARGRIGRKP